MPVFDENTAANVTDPTTTETVMVASLGVPVNLPPNAKGLRITVSVAFTEGTAGTAVTIRVRQTNAVTGAQVGASVVLTLAAAAQGVISFDVEDTSAFAFQNANAQYNVTAQQTAATGNGTAVEASIVVDEVIP